MTERTIAEVINKQTGEIIEADQFFSQPEWVTFTERRSLEEYIQRREEYLICPYCYQKVRIRGTPQGVYTMHFAHLYDSDDCPIKTNQHYTHDEILRMQYNGVKESDRHKAVKHLIAKSLLADPHFSEIESERIFHHQGGLKEWRKPDISSKFKGFHVVFEIQLSTTFLSIVVERDLFYKANQTFILWIFDNQFDPLQQKFTEKDVIYANNCNAFVVNSETLEYSQQQNEFYLHCYYLEPVIEYGKIVTHWRNQKVSFHELTFDYQQYKVHFFDFTTKYQALQTLLQQEREAQQKLQQQKEAEQRALQQEKERQQKLQEQKEAEQRALQREKEAQQKVLQENRISENHVKKPTFTNTQDPVNQTKQVVTSGHQKLQVSNMPDYFNPSKKFPCQICGKMTTGEDWWFFDTKTNTCKCKQCLREKRT